MSIKKRLARFKSHKDELAGPVKQTKNMFWGIALAHITIEIGCITYTGWPRKNATSLIVNFKNIVDETELFLFHLVEHSFPNKMTPWPLILGKVSGS